MVISSRVSVSGTVGTRVGVPPRYVTSHLPKPAQPPTLSGMGNEYYWPKFGDAVRMGSKGRYCSFHLWINGVGDRQNCDFSCHARRSYRRVACDKVLYRSAVTFL